MDSWQLGGSQTVLARVKSPMERLTIGLFTSMEILEGLLIGIENLQKGWSN